VATVEQCEQALHRLADRLAEADAGHAPKLDRRMSCTLPDLGVTFTGELTGGRLLDIAQVPRAGAQPDAQVRLILSSDDLVALVDGTLKMAPAWASKRIRIEASVLDLVKLRSIF
jgi:hypothetical protein